MLPLQAPAVMANEKEGSNDSAGQSNIIFYYESFYYEPSTKSTEETQTKAPSKPKPAPLIPPLINVPQLPQPLNLGTVDFSIPELLKPGMIGDVHLERSDPSPFVIDDFHFNREILTDLTTAKQFFYGLENFRDGNRASSIKDMLLTLIPKGSFIGLAMDNTLGPGWAHQVKLINSDLLFLKRSALREDP